MTGSVAKRDISPVGSPSVEPSLKKHQAESVPAAEPTKEPIRRTKQPKEPKLRKKRYKNKKVDETSPQGVLQAEIKKILLHHSISEDDITNDINGVLNDQKIYWTYHREVTNVEIIELTSNGEGLALISHPIEPTKKQLVIVPFAIPGDIVSIKVFKTHPNHAEADLLKIQTPSPQRDNSLIRCRYFGICSGCQYQELPYSTQLEFKKKTIQNAYEFLAPELIKQGKIPKIEETFPSPKQFEYRTKLTPHFDVPRKRELTERPPFGFGAKGKPTWRETDGGNQGIVDIEECIIGTKIINVGMINERAKFEKEWSKYKKSATTLLREHTRVIKKELNTKEFQNEQEGSKNVEDGQISCIVEPSKNDDEDLIKSCVTNPRQIVTEYINGFTFEFSAGEFFQNNNSILPGVTEYVCSNLQIKGKKPEDPLYLVDAYCGSGLFSITASKGVDRVVGVDVSKESIRFATKNAERNGVKNTKFIDGKAEKIFAEIDTPNDQTSVIIDPSRKGCDDVFLYQLSDYKPAKIVYVSCNVHSQARDIQFFLSHTENGSDYEIESIKGFDFFPQTHHVESVAVLSRK